MTQASDGEKINYNTIQIDEQLNVSTPQRAVIVRCSLIEGAEGEQDVVPAGRCGRRGCALLCLAALRKLIIHLETAEAKQNNRIAAYCTCTCAETLTHYMSGRGRFSLAESTQSRLAEREWSLQAH